MATSTDVPIYTTTLASNASIINIDLSAYQDYTNIKIVASMKLLGADGIRMRLGNTSLDTASNYSFTYLYGTGSVKGSFNGSNETSASVGDGMSDSFGVYHWYFMNYSRTDCHKTILGKSGTPTRDAQIINNLWRNNSPIKMISIYTEGSGFAAGTTVSVYGIGTATIATKATGGIISQDSTYIYHTFTSTGAFVPTQNLTNVDYLVVAGGGGSRPKIAGGGGAGGYRTTVGTSGGGASAESKISLNSGTSYTISIGAGGSGYSNGTDSYISGTGLTTITSIGGGCGGYASGSSGTNPNSGGSGGGGAGPELSSGTMTGGAGTSAQGYAGADGKSGSSSPTGWHMGAGGGGAGGAAPAITATSVIGGAGLISSIDNVPRAGGGGGGTQYGDASINASGGYGGGYGGGYFRNPTNGAAGTGGGGGGGGYGGSADTATSNGGSGVVIVRYAK